MNPVEIGIRQFVIHLLLNVSPERQPIGCRTEKNVKLRELAKRGVGMEGYLCCQDKPACALVEAKNVAVWTTVTILRSLSFRMETFVALLVLGVLKIFIPYVTYRVSIIKIKVNIIK